MTERPFSTPHSPIERHLTVSRTARYFQLGALGERTRDLWIVAHGYGQLAARFLRVFDRVAGPESVVVAPEGLSRFYVDRTGDDGAPKVGASWMTKEDRLHEIEDHVAYLDQLADTLIASIAGPRPRITALGFSQGVATIVRWLALGRSRADRIVLCGGTLPPELEPAHYDMLGAAELTLVVGKQDQFATPQVVAREEGRLREHGVPFRTLWFEGGHEVGGEVIERL
jgi:predicted esterase